MLSRWASKKRARNTGRWLWNLGSCLYEIFSKLTKFSSSGESYWITRKRLTQKWVWQDLALYYKSGSNMPFNFMFILEEQIQMRSTLNVLSIAGWTIYLTIQCYIANWVVDNHDNRRATSRFGEKRADQLSILAIVLPGVSVIYNGDEIGMIGILRTWKTKDPIGCMTGITSEDKLGQNPVSNTSFEMISIKALILFNSFYFLIFWVWFFVISLRRIKSALSLFHKNW